MAHLLGDDGQRQPVLHVPDKLPHALLGERKAQATGAAAGAECQAAGAREGSGERVAAVDDALGLAEAARAGRTCA